MALPIDVKPYTLKGVIGGDNYLTHYKAINESDEEFVITEFFPAYMVKREDDGTLGVSERFSKEFLNDRDTFIERAKGFQEIRDSSLHPVVEIMEKNYTAYIVRRACGMTDVDHFMGSQTMDYNEAYYFVRPLLISMAQVAECGMVFNINYPDFRVNNFKQLVLCAPPNWDSDFHPPLIQTIKLYYKLVTGVSPPDQGAPDISSYGIEIPSRIESMVMEILGGDILYGSMDDFYKKFKSLIDVNTHAGDDDSGKKTLAIMRMAVAVLFVMFALSLVLLVFGGIQAYKVNSYWANPDIFADSDALPEPIYDFSGFTVTHPRNVMDALTGSFATHDGFIFYRSDEGMKSRLYGSVQFVPGAAGVSALAEDRTIIPNSIPSFIVGHGKDIYFIDAAEGGVIYHSSVTGADIRRVTEFPALNLAVVEDYLYYTDVGRNHSMYCMNLNNETHELVYPYPVYSVLADGSYLFFVGEDENGRTALYSWDLYENVRIVIDENAAGRIRTFNNVLFYLDNNGRVRSSTFDGTPIEIYGPENVRTFDVYYQWMVFTVEGQHVPRAYNMDTGQYFTLSATEWVSYIWIYDSEIYTIDHRDPNLVHIFALP